MMVQKSGEFYSIHIYRRCTTCPEVNIYIHAKYFSINVIIVVYRNRKLGKIWRSLEMSGYMEISDNKNMNIQVNQYKDVTD
jgi:hypothetical protein